MRKDWIIDVLADLKAFAEHNGMDATVAGLDDAALVAVAEIASLDRRRSGGGLLPVPAQAGRGLSNVTDIQSYRRP